MDTTPALDSGMPILALDLGGTRIKAGVVVDNAVVRQRIIPTEDERGFDRVVQNLLSVAEKAKFGVVNPQALHRQGRHACGLRRVTPRSYPLTKALTTLHAICPVLRRV
jgi:pantothenate kinase type III